MVLESVKLLPTKIRENVVDWLIRRCYCRPDPWPAGRGQYFLQVHTYSRTSGPANLHGGNQSICFFFLYLAIPSLPLSSHSFSSLPVTVSTFSLFLTFINLSFSLSMACILRLNLYSLVVRVPDHTVCPRSSDPFHIVNYYKSGHYFLDI